MFCKHCGNELPNGSAFCTNCGAEASGHTSPANTPFKKISRAVSEIFFTIVGLLIIAGVIYAANPDNKIVGIKDMRESYSCAKEVILDCIETPSTAKFPRFEPEFVTQNYETVIADGEEYRVRTVSAYVDADNWFGTRVRAYFVVKIGLPKNSSSDYYYYEIIEWD